MASAVMAELQQPFARHLQELVRRLCIIAASVFPASSAAYALRAPIIAVLTKPLRQRLFYTSPTGGFNFVLDICLLVGVSVSMPIILLNVFRYVEPALPSSLRLRYGAILLGSVLLMCAGASLAYFVALPQSLRFLGSFNAAGVTSLISADSYLSFIVFYLAGFALIFQLPLLMLLVNCFSPLRLRALLGFERWIILGSFIVGAIINPAPDPVTQACTAVPLILVYQIGVVAVAATNGELDLSRMFRRPRLTWRFALLVLACSLGAGMLAAKVHGGA